MGHRIVSLKDEVDIVEAYDVRLERAADIARRHGITRQAVYKALRRNGVDTSKRRLPVTCDVCGAETHKTRAQLRRAIRVYCSQDCYRAYLEAVHAGLSWRNGGRAARKAVQEAGVELEPGNIVHHLDGNPWNNHISNLAVLANQGDHIRLHRGADVPILWSGA